MIAELPHMKKKEVSSLCLEVKVILWKIVVQQYLLLWVYYCTQVLILVIIEYKEYLVQSSAQENFPLLKA